MSINNLDRFEYANLLSGDGLSQDRLRSIISALIDAVNIIEGSGIPTQQAKKHQWYFDTATNKYYRNADGGVAWVALN